MNYLIIILAIATFISTLFGGMIILKFKSYIHYFFAFATGSIIAVTFLDILPESLEIANKLNINLRWIMLTIVLSFFIYSFIEKYFATHSLEGHQTHAHILGPIGAGSLILHSFFDGAIIGISFQISITTGIIVAIAVLFHDMTDGINTIAVMLKNHQTIKKAKFFLFLDALAPVLGILFTSLINIPESMLVFILAFFVGEFIYIGASTLLPETRSHPSKKTILAMALGIILIIVLTSLI